MRRTLPPAFLSWERHPDGTSPFYPVIRMNLSQELLREASKPHALRVAGYIGNDPGRFGALMDVFFAGPYRLTQRAAAVMNYCAEAHPGLLGPYLGRLLAYCRGPVPDAVKRNTMRLLQSQSVPEALEGELLDVCFALLENAGEAVATKVYAMTVVHNLCRRHPDLKRELALLIETQLPYQSAAFRSRGRKVLAALRK